MPKNAPLFADFVALGTFYSYKMWIHFNAFNGFFYIDIKSMSGNKILYKETNFCLLTKQLRL